MGIPSILHTYCRCPQLLPIHNTSKAMRWFSPGLFIKALRERMSPFLTHHVFEETAASSSSFFWEAKTWCMFHISIDTRLEAGVVFMMRCPPPPLKTTHWAEHLKFTNSLAVLKTSVSAMFEAGLSGKKNHGPVTFLGGVNKKYCCLKYCH